MASEKQALGEFRPFLERAERAFVSSRGSVDLTRALVVLDTNVLLAPYRTSAAALNEIKRVYGLLRKEQRLVVPGQVAREFARNRPNVVAELYKLVRDAKSRAPTKHGDLPPVLHGEPEHAAVLEALEQIKVALKSYRSALEGLSGKIENWHSRDPVLDVYEGIFDGAVVRELALEPAALASIHKARYEARIPPGYRDKGKDDGGLGDLVIWLTLLQVAESAKRDAVLVSEDKKDDWFHRAGDQAIFSRYELGVEFAEVTDGKHFRHMALSDLLKTFGAKDTVVEEVRDRELDLLLVSPLLSVGFDEKETIELSLLEKEAKLLERVVQLTETRPLNPREFLEITEGYLKALSQLQANEALNAEKRKPPP